MELHIPRHALRAHHPRQLDPMNANPRKWKNVSFFVLDFPGSQQNGGLYLYEAHVAVVMHGTDERRWTVYCFEDSAFDPDLDWIENNNFHVSEDHLDPILSNGVSSGLASVDTPWWNPREYFIQTLRNRITQAHNEWIDTVQTLETIIHGYTDGDIFFPKASGPSMRDNEEMVQTFEWTHKTLRMIQKLHENLKKTNALWINFTSPNGDVLYFTDLETSDSQTRKHIQRCLSEINDQFEGLKDVQQRLEDLEKRLKSLEQQCQTSAQVLQLRLALETSKASNLNGYVSQLMVSAVSPIGIVSTFFAIPQPVLYFERNTTSFIISVIVMTFGLQMLLVLRGDHYRKTAGWKYVASSAHVIQTNVFRAAAFLFYWCDTVVLKAVTPHHRTWWEGRG
jgi:hypothetical protein